MVLCHVWVLTYVSSLPNYPLIFNFLELIIKLIYIKEYIVVCLFYYFLINFNCDLFFCFQPVNMEATRAKCTGLRCRRTDMYLYRPRVNYSLSMDRQILSCLHTLSSGRVYVHRGTRLFY